MDKKERRNETAHVLVLLCPTQGHINPLLQFAKRLVSKGLKATIATTNYTIKSIHAPGLSVEAISDGYDENGIALAPSADTYMEQFKTTGSKTLAQLIRKLDCTGNPVNCIVYDSFLPWALDVAKECGLYGATFFTISAAVCSIYCNIYKGLVSLPTKVMEAGVAVHISMPGLPDMGFSDLPSFLSSSTSYSAYLAVVMNQFSNLEMADWVFGNTFQRLEDEVVKEMSSICPMMPIGPMVPSTYLDGRIKGDTDYGANLWKPIRDTCSKWLDTKPNESVVYVSFGSRIELLEKQMEELAVGLKESNKNFLWVLKEYEQSKLPYKFLDSIEEKGLVVAWCDQMEVLAHKALSCFITHCGWNSTLEGLSLGVPMVAMPQWTDQPTNAKFVEEVWGVGVRAKVDEEGIVRREEVKLCIREVSEGERNQEIKRNASKWKELAKEAIGEGGSSDKNIDEFVENLLFRSECQRGGERTNFIDV